MSIDKYIMYCVVYQDGTNKYYISKDIALRDLLTEHIFNKNSSAHMLTFEQNGNQTLYELRQKTFVFGLQQYILQNQINEASVLSTPNLVNNCFHNIYL